MRLFIGAIKIDGNQQAVKVSSLRRKLPIDLISEGRGKRRVWGESRKNYCVILPVLTKK